MTQQVVLITGARGYLGGRLIQGLAVDPRIRVVGTSRNRTAHPAGWPTNAQLICVDPSVEGEAAIAAALTGVDTVIHLAAPNEIESVEDPVGSLTTGAVGSLKLLRSARAASCRRFIFLSTIHVYGSPLKGKIIETDAANPVHPYAIVHRTAEDFLRAAQMKKEIEGVVLRLSNAIGAPAWPDVNRWSLIGNDLCRQAVTQGRIVLKSSGLQWRDFILVRDFVSAVRHMLDVPAQALGDGLFNLGGRLPLRIIDVAETVARRASALLGREIPVIRAPESPGESWEKIDFSIDRIAAAGFQPSPASDLDGEIDATLRLCRTGFAREAGTAS